MPTYDFIRISLFTAQPNVQWTYACPLDPLDILNVHALHTSAVCPLDTIQILNNPLGTSCPLDPMNYEMSIRFFNMPTGHPAEVLDNNPYRSLISDLSVQILQSVVLGMTFVEKPELTRVDLLINMMLDVMENATLENFGVKEKKRDWTV
jgi:hypothetical protein